MCTHMKMLRVHVPGICCSDMSPRVSYYSTLRDDARRAPRKLNFMGHVAGTKSPQNWCCTIIKVSAHTRGHVAATYPWDMYPQHFHVCAHVILSLLHVPATCHLSVNYTSFFCRCGMSLRHVAATCPCNMTARVSAAIGFTDTTQITRY